MRIQDELQRGLGLERESHEITKRMLGDRDVRISELEKERDVLKHHIAVSNAVLKDRA